jgi:hypothetical protein
MVRFVASIVSVFVISVCSGRILLISSVYVVKLMTLAICPFVVEILDEIEEKPESTEFVLAYIARLGCA